MKILVDENIPRISVAALKESGHDVLDLRGTPEEGIPDSLVWKKAQQEARLLVSTDKAFARLREQNHSGILLVCLNQPNRVKIHERILWAMNRVPPEQWPCLLVVMRDTVQSVWPARVF